MGLPYVILDFPRLSDPDEFVFIRIMFWWGHFFSSTLQVGGNRKEGVCKHAASKLDLLQSSDYYLCVNSDPWAHHFEATNYSKLSEMDKEIFLENASRSDYIKIAAKWPLSEWHFAADELFESWKFLLQISGLIT
jgi:hypothetical protein